MEKQSQAAPRDPYADLASELDRGSSTPLYTQIEHCFRRAIEAGQLAPGATVPPQRALCRRLGVSEVTLRRALQSLAGQGLITARAGGGTAIASRGHSPAPSGGGAPGHSPAKPAVATLGIAMADITDGYPFLEPFLAGLRGGDENPASIRLFDTPAPRAQRPDDYDALLAGLDGLVMMSPVDTPLLAACHRRELPVVLFFSDFADGRSHCVVVDYRRGVLHAVHHLYDRGLRRIALVTAATNRFSTGQLLDAYRDAIEIHDLAHDPELILHGGYSSRAGYDATSKLLMMSKPPEGILFASDRQAQGGIIAARERKIAVGPDLAIIGAGDPDKYQGVVPKLTMIDLRLGEAGVESRRLLTHTGAAERCSLPSRLRAGETS